MQFKLLSLAALAATVSAQSLVSVLTSNPDLSNLTTFVSSFPTILASLNSTTNITLLAPSNAAFAKFLNASGISLNNTAAIQAVLTYHVLTGVYYASQFTKTPAFIPTLLNNPQFSNVTGGQRVEAELADSNVTIISGLLQKSNVTTPNLNFTGGVVHVIDTVLTLPQNVSTTATAAGLTSVVGALIDTNLAAAVDSLSDVTVFAPSNDAFSAIGSVTGNLSVSQLAGILEYHVVNGTVGYSTSLSNGLQLTALNGEKLTITINNGSIFVNSAPVVIPDVLVAGGVVHVIGEVLNPNATTLLPNPTATVQSVAFAGASSGTAVPFTSFAPAPTSATTTSSAKPTSSASSTGGAAMAMPTGAIGLAALFAAGAAGIPLINL